MNEDTESKKRFDFVWNTKNGLRKVSDKSLKIGMKLLENSKISITRKEKKDKSFIIINNNIIKMCDYNTTSEELLNIIENEKNMFKGFNLYKTTQSEFKRNENIEIDYVCDNCKFQTCPKWLVGYLYYLRENGELEEKLKDREEYRHNNKIDDNFDFVWEVDDYLKNVPDDIFEYCCKIQEKNLIHVNKSLENGFVIINSALSCKDYKDLSFELIEKKSNESRSTKITRNTVNPAALCKPYICRHKICPFLISGIIEYLKRTNKEDIIKKCRDYYHENQTIIDKQLLENKENKLIDMEIQTYKTVENILLYKNRVDNVDNLAKIIADKQQKNLHCTIEGKYRTGINKFIDKIADTLKNTGKIDEIEKLTMHNFFSKLVVAEQGGTWNSGQNVYNYLSEKKLYIITNVEEFIYDYNLYKQFEGQSGIYPELRTKQLRFFFDTITDMIKENYIIICGDEKDITKLIDMDSRMKFVYGENRFKFPNLTLKSMFNIYCDNIKSDLVEDLRKENKNIQEKFFEYVSLNEKFLPFDNEELAKYLATYSNSNNMLIFPENIYKKETIEESFANIIGMDNVKEKVREFEQYALFSVKAKAKGIKIQKTNLHMIFTGNPGTGKTMMARIMAKMLYDLGIIEENKLIEVERKDLIGRYIGQTAPKTAEIIEKAMGGVLFIDEAYSLVKSKSNNDYGSEAIATLIKAMEDYKDKIVVIFAGYKNEMKDFIDSNPGIASRIGYKFDFLDYTIEELKEMFYSKMNKMGFNVSKDIEIPLKEICRYFSRRKDFGNGRFIDSLIQETLMNHSKNEETSIEEIVLEDFPSIEEMNNTTNNKDNSAEQMLKDLIGMDELKSKIKDFESYVKFIRAAEKINLNIDSQNMHMVFTGNPGTGKTTVARIIARILFELGVIHENKLIEVERKDLIAEYIGQTAKKTNDIIEKSLGGVLFIDEAYSLAQRSKNDFGNEAVATLIKAMEDHKNDFVVIFAGYKKEMGEFIDTNPGIASRIGYVFDFPDYTDNELVDILVKKIEKSGMVLESGALEHITKIMKYFCNVENIGNGRFVNKVFQEIMMKHARNQFEDIGQIYDKDIPTIEEMTKIIFNGQSMINPDEITKDDILNVARHEVGHAIVRLILFKESGIKKITINPEGTGTLGYVKHDGFGKDQRITKTKLLNRIKVSLAGMAAEKVYNGEFSTGNSGDLQNATSVAKKIIESGMSNLGLGSIKGEGSFLEKEIQDEINNIFDICFKETIEIIEGNRNKIDNIVNYLMEKKEITEDELIKYFQI